MMAEESKAQKPSFSFKKRKNANIRKRPASDEEDGDEECDNLSSKIEEEKLLRKIRKRQMGVSAEGLLVGKVDPSTEGVDDDPFKTQSGGLLDLSVVKQAKKTGDDAYDTGIGTAFSAETNRRDEDAEMQKYIEEKLSKRKGKQETKEEIVDNDKYQSMEEAALHSLPEFLKKSSSKKSEEMLSNQMLSGIPEVDLGLEAKIRNIEATEEAKQKMIRDRMAKKDGPSQFVPTNMAVNFVQHNRFNLDGPANRKKQQQQAEQQAQQQKKKKAEEVVEAVVGGGIKVSTSLPKEKNPPSKASDDFHYEKFMKQFRRH